MVILVFFSIILIAGCATWSKTAGNYTNTSEQFSADLPWGWMMHKGKELILTKDGIFLENIVIKRKNAEDKLLYTKKKFVEGMLPEEIAEIELDEMRCNANIGNLEVIENSPVEISGIKGFKLVYTFANEDGLKKKTIHYGFGHKEWVYEISYTATQWNYYDKELDAFNKLVESFKFLG
jgi:hypothetical protein